MHSLAIVNPRTLLTLVALLGLWCVFLWDVFWGDRVFSIFLDNEFYIGTMLSLMSEALSEGQWPLRITEVIGGVPIYNTPLLSPFYPFYFSYLPIYDGPEDVVHSMHWITLFHFLVFEGAVYFLLRVIGVSRISAIMGGALVAFSANSFIYAVWLTIVAPYSWLPLYLAGLIGTLRNPGSLRYPIIALTGLVLLVFASPAHPLIHTVFVSIVFVAVFLWKKYREGEIRKVPYTLAPMFVVGGLAFLIVSPVVLPALFEMQDKITFLGPPFPSMKGNEKMPFEAFLTDQLVLSDLGGIFFKFKSHLVGQQFVGVIVLALAALAVLFRRKCWIVISLVFVAAYSLISALGDSLGLAYLNYHIPLINKMREPSRFLVLFQLSLGILAAIGLDELRKFVLNKSETAIKAVWVYATLGGVAIMGTVVALVAKKQIVSFVSPWIFIGVLLALMAATWLFKRLSFEKRDLFLALLWSSAALVLLGKTITAHWESYPITHSLYLQKENQQLDKVVRWIATQDPERQYRVIFDGKIKKQIASMLAAYHGVRSFSGCLNPVPRKLFQQVFYRAPQDNNYYRGLGAKYLVCKECKPRSLKGYRLVHTIEDYDILEASDSLPYHYIAGKIDGIFHNLNHYKRQAKELDLRQKILFVQPGVKQQLKLDANNSTREDHCESREEFRGLNSVRIHVSCKNPGVLVLNEFFDTNWKALVNDDKQHILQVNGNQIGVAFPAGENLVEFRYAPTLFKICLALMALGFVLTLSLILYYRKDADFLENLNADSHKSP